MLPKFLKPYHLSRSSLVRLGPKTDGGYIIDKRILKASSTLITCGLNDDWEFERDFFKQNKKCKILAFDHTINKKYWRTRFKKDFISLLLFKKLKIDKILDVFKFIDYHLFFKKNIKHYQKKIVLKKKNNKEITIPNILAKLHKIILKVDIEGDEYKILNDIKKNTKKIVCLVIEFHDIHKNIKKIKKFLANNDLKIIHLHANNYGGINKNKDPKVIELSLINSKMINIKKRFSNKRYPINNLDYKNFKRREDIKIKFYE